MTRMHAETIDVAAKRDGDTWVLAAPSPGWFVPAVTDGDLVAPGHAIGELEVLGRRILLIAPEVHGLAADADGPRAVGFGDVLLRVDTSAQLGTGAKAASAPEQAGAAGGLVFRAPTSGRYYGRAAPDKAPFLAVGAELGPGTTVCLLEVMKTFNRVAYAGARARVTELLVADGADVTAGDPLIALEPI